MKRLLLLILSCFLVVEASSSSKATISDLLLASVQLSPEQFDLVQMSSLPDLKHLRASAFSEQNYLGLLFHTFESNPATSLSEDLFTDLIIEFVNASKELPETIACFDYSRLSQAYISALGMTAACSDNLALFEHLVKTKVFDLSAVYEWRGSRGNAVVFLITNLEALKMARKAGLDLSQPVFAPDGTSTSGFCYLEGTLIENSDLKKRTVSEEAPLRQKCIRTDSVEWDFLLNTLPDSEVLLTDPVYLRIIQSRLVEEGPGKIAELIGSHPRVLERTDFLPMLRAVLHDDIPSIARIYAVNIEKTESIIPMIDEQLPSTEAYAKFLFELFKRQDGVKLLLPFAELFSENEQLLSELNFGEIPETNLVILARIAVKFEAFALLEKIRRVNKSLLEVRPNFGITRNSIYSMVQSPRMLRKLFEYRVPIPTWILTDSGPLPFAFHFMRANNPQFKEAIKSSRIIPMMKIMHSVAYCQSIGATELASELADMIGFTKSEE